MSRELVTVASFYNAADATLAQDRLDEAGIATYLADEAVVGLGWHLSNAVGRLKIQVEDKDQERALTVLAETPPPLETSPNAYEVETTPSNEREKNAERLFRGAIVAYLFWPLHLWVLTLLIRTFISSEGWRPRFRRKAIWGAVIHAPALVLLGWYVVAVFGPS